MITWHYYSLLLPSIQTIHLTKGITQNKLNHYFVYICFNSNQQTFILAQNVIPKSYILQRVLVYISRPQLLLFIFVYANLYLFTQFVYAIYTRYIHVISTNSNTKIIYITASIGIAISTTVIPSAISTVLCVDT